MLKPRDDPRSLFIRPIVGDFCPPLFVLELEDDEVEDSKVAEEQGNTEEAQEEQEQQQQQQQQQQQREEEVEKKEEEELSIGPVVTAGAQAAGYSMQFGDGSTTHVTPRLVRDFTVTRAGLGSIRWLDPVNLRVPHLSRAEIDRVVRIEHGAVFIYSEECGVHCPAPGQGLKKRAEVTLYGCHPRPTKEGNARPEPVKEGSPKPNNKEGNDENNKNERKTSGATPGGAGGEHHAEVAAARNAKYTLRVMKQTARMGAELIEYDADTGVWRFALQL